MMVENELDAYISGSPTSTPSPAASPPTSTWNTTLTVIAGNLVWPLALKLSRYERATPETLWRDFLDATGTLHISQDDVTCALNSTATTPP